MSELERRLLLIFAGRLDQSHLDDLRQALGLARSGRLTDREDQVFGSREVGGNGSPSMTLDLSRSQDDRWAISLDVASDADVGTEEIAQWQAQAETAASTAGLQVVERRSFPMDRHSTYQTDWRNENWLRTAKWDLPAQNLQELWPVLGVPTSAPPAAKRAELLEFMASPTWEAAPERIQQEAEEFLR